MMKVRDINGPLNGIIFLRLSSSAIHQPLPIPIALVVVVVVVFLSLNQPKKACKTNKHKSKGLVNFVSLNK